MGIYDMKKIIVFLSVFILASCASFRSGGGNLERVTAQQTGCQPQNLKVYNVNADEHVAYWNALCGNKRYLCSAYGESSKCNFVSQ